MKHLKGINRGHKEKLINMKVEELMMMITNLRCIGKFKKTFSKLMRKRMNSILWIEKNKRTS